MVRVRIKEVIDNKQILDRKVQTLQTSLTNVSAKMTAVPQTPGFSGQAKRAMANYANKTHQTLNHNLVNDLTELQQQYQRLIQVFASEVDSSPDAVLDSNYVKEVATKFKTNQAPLEDALEECNRAISSVADIVSLQRLSNDPVDDVKKMVRSASKTVEKLQQFNSSRPTATMQGLNQQTVKLGSEIKSIGSIKSKKEKTIVQKLLDSLKGVLSSDDYKRIKMLAKTDPEKAMKAILKSDLIMKAISEHPKLVKELVQSVTAYTIATGARNLEYLNKFWQDVKKGTGYFNKFNKYLPDVLNGSFGHVGKTMLGSFKVIKKSGLTEYGTPKAFGWNVVLNTGADYADQKHHDLGRAVSDGVIDSIFDIGPVSGALTVAAISTSPLAIGLAAVFGTGILITKFVNPHVTDQFKSGAHSFEKYIGKEFSQVKFNNVFRSVNYVKPVL